MEKHTRIWDSQVLLEEYRALGLYDPKWHVMYHPNLDRKLVRFVLDCIREGKSSFVFINTEVSRKALEHIGIEPKDAKRLTVTAATRWRRRARKYPAPAVPM